jgi:hypothetical protein
VKKPKKTSNAHSRPRFEALTLKLRSATAFEADLAAALNRKLKKNQRVIYVAGPICTDHGTYWELIIETLDFVTLRVRVPERKSKIAIRKSEVRS